MSRRMVTVRRLLAFVFLCCSTLPAHAAISLVPLVTGLASPIFATHAGDGTNRLFIIEQAGIVKVVQPGSNTPTDFLDIRTRVLAGGERGLLGVAFHPNYRNSGRFFVYYTRQTDGTIVVAEYRASSNPNVAATNEILLLTITHPAGNHNGGMLAFGPDGYLYIGVGDGGGANDTSNNAQNINTLLGKILRIDVDAPAVAYASPPTNPYFGTVPGRDEIFAIGMRNPWRFSFDRRTGQQWVADVGQGAREEVSSPIVNGGNYGWRVFEGSVCSNLDPGLCANASNYIPPLFDYAHTGGRCSITGGYVYRGTLGTLPQGTYIFGDFCTGELFQWNGATQALLLDTTMSISSFAEDELGEPYVIDLSGGTLNRLVSTTQATLDVDASIGATKYDAKTDGLLMIRYLFGLGGSPLTSGATGATATRSDPRTIAAFIENNRGVFDLDDNGEADALTDGLMIVRYLLGFRGSALTQGAIGSGARRATPALIESYIAMLTP